MAHFVKLLSFLGAVKDYISQLSSVYYSSLIEDLSAKCTDNLALVLNVGVHHLNAVS